MGEGSASVGFLLKYNSTMLNIIMEFEEKKIYSVYLLYQREMYYIYPSRNNQMLVDFVAAAKSTLCFMYLFKHQFETLQIFARKQQK